MAITSILHEDGVSKNNTLISYQNSLLDLQKKYTFLGNTKQNTC